MPEDFQHLQFMEGLSQYNNARMRAFWDEVFSLMRGKPAELLSFEDIRARLRLREEYYQGLQDIELDKIVGSVGRYREFTRHFLPKRRVQQERWSRVFAVATGMMGLPPIEVYKVGDVYFVRDGNHRVSVARQMGNRTIQAHVWELPTSLVLKPDMDEKDIDALAAYAMFLDATRLPYTRPHHQSITLSEPSRYEDLLGHVALHQAVLKRRTGEDIDFEDAAADWYDNVYRPAVTLIRKYDVLKHSAQRTEGDLYLWMIEHLREVRDELGDDAPSRTFSDALEDFLVEKRLPVPTELRAEKDATVTLTRVNLDAELDAYRARRAAAEAAEQSAAASAAQAAAQPTSSDGVNARDGDVQPRRVPERHFLNGRPPDRD
ncbi:MAG: hypothetical protein SF162_14380 [bacterium]|nr:hypothetical protein [bacterium]